MGAPGLDKFPRDMSPIFLSQGLWNHGLTIFSQMSQIGLKWPKLRGTEIMDLLKYIWSEAKGAKEGPSFKFGNPREGKEIFDEKGCNKCHSVHNEGAKMSEDLGKIAKTFYTSSSQIASSMWNKGPTMLAKISQIQSESPKFTYKEMADLLTYLYFLRFIDEPGDPKKGRSLFSEKKCSTCHDIDKISGRLMHIDLSKYENAPQTEIVASIWNHSIEIYNATVQQGIPWPQFKKGEMADLLEFIRTPKK
jgi:cytochrome c2